MKPFRLAMAGILFLLSLPLFGVVFAGTTAKLLRCALDEGSVHPCYLAGVSIGPLLTYLGVAGWFMLVSLPTAAIVLVIWLTVESLRFVRMRTRAS